MMMMMMNVVQYENKNTTNFRIYFDPKCDLHLSVVNRLVDKPCRTKNSIAYLQRIFDNNSFYKGELATEEIILTFHTQLYLYHIQYYHQQLTEQELSGLGFQCHDIGTLGPSFMDIYSYDAALAAVGTAMKAVKDCLDLIIDRHKYTAFVLVRPPGHHAHKNKTHGMCIFNNVAITALFLIEKGYHVVVLDFDTHHGDGISEGLKENENVFIGGTYEKDQAPALNDNPMEDTLITNNSKFSLKPLPKNCNSNEFHWNWANIMLDSSAWVNSKKSTTTLDKPIFVLIAAGFDGHVNEKIASCKLQYNDYAIVTRRILQFCKNFHSPCVSVLEGGYDIDILPSCIEAHLKEMSHYSNTGHISSSIPEFNLTTEYEQPVAHQPIAQQITRSGRISKTTVQRNEINFRGNESCL